MLNPNIILQGRGVEINNPMDVAVKGMQLKQLSQQSQLADRALQDDQTMRDAYTKNITKGADGKMSLNRQGMMTSLGPKQAFDFQKLMQGQDLEKMAADTKISGQLAFSVQDEPTYFQARAKALEIGLPNADKLPEQYSPMIVQRWQMGTMSGAEQIAKAMADQKLGYQKEQDVLAQENKDRDHRLAVEKLRMEKTEALQKEGKRSSEDKKMGSYVTEGIRGAKAMREAVSKGVNTFSIVGDNDFTKGLDQYAENFGRMQSGGAINKDEEVRFKRMAPGIGDNAAMKQKKLNSLDAMFNERAKVYGVDLKSAGLGEPQSQPSSGPSLADVLAEAKKRGMK